MQLHIAAERTACGLESCGWVTGGLLHYFCPRGSCVLWSMCRKVSAIAKGVLGTEAVLPAPEQIPAVAAGVGSVEQVCGSGYSNTPSAVGSAYHVELSTAEIVRCMETLSLQCLLDAIRFNMPGYIRVVPKCESPCLERYPSEIFPK